jgi:hypothetical protein
MAIPDLRPLKNNFATDFTDQDRILIREIRGRSFSPASHLAADTRQPTIGATA